VPTPAANVYQFGAFEVNPASGELLKSGKRVRIQDQPFRLLVILLENAGQVVTREEIQSRIWTENTFVDFDSGLRVAVRKLRDALGDDAENPQYVETIPKRGYRLMVSATHTEAAPALRTHAGSLSALDIRASQDDGMRERAVGLSARKWVFSGILAMVAIATATFLFFSHGPRKLSGGDMLVLADFSNSTGDPVFDGTLRQGMAVQLEQSPFLNLISDQRIQQTLRLMNQPADARLTPEIAREICERTGSAGVLEGSISNLGTQYVLGLRAKNCRTGEMLDEEQTQTAKKEDVLSALDHMASSFRSRVGESLATVEKYSTPLEETTTPSLEALKAYSTGVKLAFSSGFAAGVPLLERAVEIDSQFAMAHAHLGLWYSSIGESVLATASTSKAYALRDRVTDREKFFITAMYHRDVTGDLEAAHQTLELWEQTYPRDLYVHGLLSGFSSQATGRYGESIDEAKKALAIDPDFTPGYINLGFSDFYLDRFNDAKSTVDQAFARKLDVPEILLLRFYLAFLNGDEAGMTQAAAAAKGKPGAEDWMAYSDALVLARSGHLQMARQMSRRAAELAQQSGQKERAATYEAGEAVWEALSGSDSAAKKGALSALALSKGRDTEYAAGFALALAGELPRAKSIASDLEKRFPADTSVKFNYVPALRGLFALHQRAPARSLEVLQTAAPYDFAVPAVAFNTFFGSLYPVWVRGNAYLAQRKGPEAAAEFQKLLDHRGLLAGDPVGPLARLQLGRAYAVSGDVDKARAAYQDFLQTWKNADPELPVLKLATAEYAKLR
jgi:DNA-binding winged helix-turn-helix (wHTH) protein/tetratricopeptide (TPR) repeat protein